MTHRQVALDTKLLEELKRGARAVTGRVQELAHLVAELERGALEAHVIARGDLEHEAKVDVDEVAPRVEENVTVMSVFRLKEEARDSIAKGQQQ